MVKNRRNYDPDETGGIKTGSGPGSISDPTESGGATYEGGSPRPDPMNQKTTDDGRIRYSGNSPNVGGGRGSPAYRTNKKQTVSPSVASTPNTKGGLINRAGGDTTQSGQYDDQNKMNGSNPEERSEK